MTATEPLITVCDHCLCASCWQGLFLCDEAYGAGTIDKPRAELVALGREHPSYWEPGSSVLDMVP